MVTLLQGDAEEHLRGLPDRSVDCAVTSPPYYGIRDYEVSGQIGLEATPERYIQRLVQVFAEVRRVLADTGSLWLVLNDSYARAPGKGGSGTPTGRNGYGERYAGARRPIPEGVKPKDLMGIPWQVALALRADGWWLRSDCIWWKPNVKPDAAKDRPTRCHEYVFLLTKSERYYWNGAAAREPAREGTRNLRTVWPIPTTGGGGLHHAVFPPALARQCIEVSCPEGGLVLDPFAGSGTVGAAALALGRGAVLIELNARYVESMRRRLG